MRRERVYRGWEGGKLSNMLAAKGDLIASMSSEVGRPVTSMMRSSWFMVDVPGNMGLPPSSSPRIQPIDHISTPFVYLDSSSSPPPSD